MGLYERPIDNLDLGDLLSAVPNPELVPIPAEIHSDDDMPELVPISDDDSDDDMPELVPISDDDSDDGMPELVERSDDASPLPPPR